MPWRYEQGMDDGARRLVFPKSLVDLVIGPAMIVDGYFSSIAETPFYELPYNILDEANDMYVGILNSTGSHAKATVGFAKSVATAVACTAVVKTCKAVFGLYDIVDAFFTNQERERNL